MATDVWPLVERERRALAEDLTGVDDEGWQQASLCAGWSTHDVLAHMTATAKMTPAEFVTSLAGAGFSFDRMTGKKIARETTGGPAQTLAEFGKQVTSRKHPPGPPQSWLGETVVHGEDIRRPLGIRHEYDGDALRLVADFYPRSNLLIGTKRRIAGLHLQATDADWETGSGSLVRGPLLSLLLAMTGRQAALDDLTGDGVETLRSRS